MAKTLFLIVFFLATGHSLYAADNIAVIGLFKDKALVNIDGRQRLLTLGNPSPEGIVLIRANSKGAVLEIDGVQREFNLNTRISNTYLPPSGGKTVSITPDDSGMYWVNGSVNDFQVKFVVDTGASLIAMNKHEANRLGIDYKNIGLKTVSNTAAGPDEVYIINLKKVKMGDIELKNIAAAVHDGDFPSVMLLGNSFLSKIDMKREGRLLQFNKQ